ncbi:MAG: trypsin-like peptidase domain-containing protein [Actinobacteria bacterium]|nr:trypsin-like peptidase domain-containing protein [Actinomycetota bacterium]
MDGNEGKGKHPVPGGARPGDYSAPGPGGEVQGMPGPEGPGRPGSGIPPLTPGGGGGEQPPVEFLPLPKRSDSRKRKGRGGVFLVALVAAIIGALIVLVAFPWAFGVNPWDLVRGKVAKKATTQVAPKGVVKIVSPTQGAVNVAVVAKRATASIVNIDIRTAPQQGPFFDIAPQEGTGSGVIYTEDGYILTNNHVVKDAQEITVTLASGQELKGKKVGADPDNDIAVVKIDKTGLPTLRVGNSDDLVVGELAVAVGSPFGFEQSVTAGIISALHRSISAGSQDQGQSPVVLTDLIQTDAAINPGNSGGALCDSKARLVGINAVIASASGGSEGVGFAIPIDTVKKVADDIIAGRPVSHPYMGVLGQSITADIATQYGLPVSKGAYMTRVIPDGPAGKAGIKNGDIVVAADGKPVNSMDDLIGEIRSRGIGAKMSVTYYSGKDKKTVEVTLEEKPKSAQ